VGTRHRARQYAVQVLFQLDVTGEDPTRALPPFWEDRQAPEDIVRFTEQLVVGTWARRAELDALLEESAAHWRLDRMAMVDRNVLRLALFELLHGAGTPSPVVLNEAIELAKRFGNADSGPVVNGVLDGIRQRLDDGTLHAGDRRPSAPRTP
jgi:N utilization substance protein B